MSGWKDEQIIENPSARIAIVASRFNSPIVQQLLDRCIQKLTLCKVPENNISLSWVPGAFEIPLMAKRYALQDEIDAVITLGVVIQGDTPHFTYVCTAAANGVLQASLETNKPIIFGVLTTNTEEQALERIEKGEYTAAAALSMISEAVLHPS